MRRTAPRAVGRRQFFSSDLCRYSRFAGDFPRNAEHAVGVAVQEVALVDHQPADFDVAPGESFGFLGPNGAGKTTVFNLITGIVPATAGETASRSGPMAARSCSVISSLDTTSTEISVRGYLRR